MEYIMCTEINLTGLTREAACNAMEYSPPTYRHRWAEAPLLLDIHLALRLLSISELYLTPTWRDSCHQHPTQTWELHQPGDTLSLASNDCWEKVPSACLTAAKICWSGFVIHVSLTCSPFGGVVNTTMFYWLCEQSGDGADSHSKW